MATPPEAACKECNNKSIDRRLNLWTHQNTLLWGRLQTISALQLAIFAGWYATFVKGSGFCTDFLGATIAAIGLFLSVQLRRLILADIKFRNQQRDKIRELQKAGIPEAEHLFPIPKLPEIDGIGAETMRRTVRFFVGVTGVLVMLSSGKLVFCLFYWVACGCSCWR